MDIQAAILTPQLDDLKEYMRTSTPESINKCFSPQLSLSEIENSDNENIVSLSNSLISQKTTNTNLFINPPRKLEDMPSTSSYIKRSIPTPFKHSKTPFKDAFYFPKKVEPTKKRITKKVTPTVAIAEEFMEHQRRIEKDKEEKEKLKMKRKRDAIEKKIKKNVTQKKKMMKRAEPNPMKSPTLSFHLPMLNNKQSQFKTPSPQRACDREIDAVEKVKRYIFDSDSDDSIF